MPFCIRILDKEQVLGRCKTINCAGLLARYVVNISHNFIVKRQSRKIRYQVLVSFAYKLIFPPDKPP